MKTLFVGLDAACWEYVNPLLASGRMPTLQKLIDTGISGALRSTMPALTPVAWSSIITGKNPGQHGIYDMLWRRPGSYEFAPVNGGLRQGSPFWAWLNRAGLRVGVVDAPFSYPFQPLDAFLICGFGTPDSVKELTYPAGLHQTIESRFGPYAPRARLKELRKKISTTDLLTSEREHQAQLVEIAGTLAAEQAVDVLVINLMLLDHTNHYAENNAQIETALSQLDQDLARLLELFRPDVVLAFSDHGSRRVQGEFLLHNWLVDEGYCVRQRNNPAGQRQALRQLLQHDSFHSKRLKPFDSIRHFLRRNLLTKLLPPTLAKKWLDPAGQESVEFAPTFDFQQTRLYVGSTYSGNLYFNVAGRDPAGSLSWQQRQQLQQELGEKLLASKDPAGQPLFSAIYTPEQLYSGPATANAPDLILDGYDSPWNAKLIYPGRANERYFRTGRGDTGWHSRDGLFVFNGHPFGSGRVNQLWNVTDLPATLLYLYNIPIPQDYDGRPMTELFHTPHPIQSQPGDSPAGTPTPPTTYTDDQSAELLAHLRSLGYVD